MTKLGQRVRRTGRYAVPLAALLLSALLGCPSTQDESTPPATRDDLPEWLDDLIGDLESQPAADPPASITRYEFKGQEVYFLPPRCCDIPSDLYGADGDLICHPSGGITGGGDGQCPDFFDERTGGTVVWEDSRAG